MVEPLRGRPAGRWEDRFGAGPRSGGETAGCFLVFFPEPMLRPNLVGEDNAANCCGFSCLNSFTSSEMLRACLYTRFKILAAISGAGSIPNNKITATRLQRGNAGTLFSVVFFVYMSTHRVRCPWTFFHTSIHCNNLRFLRSCSCNELCTNEVTQYGFGAALVGRQVGRS